MVLTMSFTTERQTLTTSVFFCAVVLCVSFVSQGQCQTPAPPTRKLNVPLKSSKVNVKVVISIAKGTVSHYNYNIIKLLWYSIYKYATVEFACSRSWLLVSWCWPTSTAVTAFYSSRLTLVTFLFLSLLSLPCVQKLWHLCSTCKGKAAGANLGAVSER